MDIRVSRMQTSEADRKDQAMKPMNRTDKRTQRERLEADRIAREQTLRRYLAEALTMNTPSAGRGASRAEQFKAMTY